MLPHAKTKKRGRTEEERRQQRGKGSETFLGQLQNPSDFSARNSKKIRAGSESTLLEENARPGMTKTVVFVIP